MLTVGKDHGRAAVPQELVDLMMVEGRIQGHSHGAGRHYTQIGRHPERAIRRHDGAAHAYREPGFRQPPAYGLRTLAQLRVSEAFHRSRSTLQLSRYMVGILLNGFEEATVKAVHQIPSCS